MKSKRKRLTLNKDLNVIKHINGWVGGYKRSGKVERWYLLSSEEETICCVVVNCKQRSEGVTF